MTDVPRYKRCIVLLADGSRPDVFAELLAKGDLPHLARECAERQGFKSITSVFPSTTGPAYFPYLTGCFPGTCNVPGIRWFDKAQYARGPLSRSPRHRSYVGIETDLINRDMKPEIATLFDLFPKSYNILNAVSRGVLPERNLTRWARIWLLYYGHLTDSWRFVDRKAHEYLKKAVKEDFDFIFAGFPGIDEYGHRSNPREPAALEQYRFVDAAFGELVETLKADGRWEETLFLLVSDHGMSATHSHMEIFEFLGERGLKTFYYPMIHQRGCKAASMISGNGMANVYIDINRPLGRRMVYEELVSTHGRIISDLKSAPAVDIFACQDSRGRVHFFYKGKEGIIEDVGGNFHYSFADTDPLGIFDAPVILDSTSALEATVDSEHPDLLVQLSQLFKSPRTGDIALSAASGWDFRKRYEVPLHKASHGSLSREHMRIPLFSNHPLPDVPMRSVDVFPFILHLLGKDSPELIDGRVLGGVNG